MARPAACAKQYSWVAALAGLLGLAGLLAAARAGIVTGTAACSPSWAASCRLAWQAVALSDTATWVGAAKLTLSVPHSTEPARNAAGRTCRSATRRNQHRTRRS